MRARTVVEVEHAIVALAAAYEREITGREQLGGRQRYRQQQLSRGRAREPRLEPERAAILHEHALLVARGEKRVQRIEMLELLRGHSPRDELPDELPELARGP